MKHSKSLNTGFLVSLLFLSVTDSYAFPKTDNDFAMLPPYCAARSGRTSPAHAKLWEKRIGKNWTHIHHYCSALDHMNHANLSTNRKKIPDMLKSALGGFDYMLENGSSNFPLLPELHAKKGEIFKRLGNTAQAVKEYEQSISINPKYTKGYSGLSDLYKSLGDKAEAINTLKRGLKYKPSSRLLKRKLKLLEK